jgi:DNA helicase HerA-like ATPase
MINENSVVGTIVSDEISPSFGVFRFKAKHDKYVTPGSLVGTVVSADIFLIGRVTGSHEHNPHEEASKVAVRDTMGIKPDYPRENLSLTIHRDYDVEVIAEVKKTAEMVFEVYPPEKMPRSGSDVFVPQQEIIMDVMGLETDPGTSLNLGTVAVSLAGEDKVPVRIKRNTIQRHVFIGGTTGGGKSYGAKVLAEEIHKHKIPIIFFDTQYEFAPLARALKGEVLRPGENYTIKLSSLSEAELLDLIPTLKHELHVSILTRAFLRLKEGIQIPQTTLGTFVPQRRTIGLNELITEIGTVGSEMNANQHSVDIVTDRTRHYLRSYNFIGEEFNWTKVLTPSSVTAIDCQGFSGQSLQLVLASTLRELSELRKATKINPFVIFIDEAHLFVPQDEESPCKQIIRESVRIGRHYGICVVLITQSPVDIDKKAIRQCNTRLLFAIESDQLQAIQGVKSDATQEMIDRLPKAPVGTCILTGTYETIKHAIPVRIRLMDNPDADAGKAPDIFQEVSKSE